MCGRAAGWLAEGKKRLGEIDGGKRDCSPRARLQQMGVVRRADGWGDGGQGKNASVGWLCAASEWGVEKRAFSSLSLCVCV